MPVTVFASITPNPNAMKFTLDRPVSQSGSRTFASAEEAAADPLAAGLFAVPGVKMVFFLNDFVTVTKQPDADWGALKPACEEAIIAHFGG